MPLSSREVRIRGRTRDHQYGWECCVGEGIGVTSLMNAKPRTCSGQLKRLQNKCLLLITGAFKTSPTFALEIEASIPPIDIYMEYKLDMEALRLSRLNNNHPVISRITHNDRLRLSHTHPPPLPNHLINHRRPRRTRKPPPTCIARIASRIQEHTERSRPLAMAPWHESDMDNQERVVTFLPPN